MITAPLPTAEDKQQSDSDIVKNTGIREEVREVDDDTYDSAAAQKQQSEIQSAKAIESNVSASRTRVLVAASLAPVHLLNALLIAAAGL